MKVDKLYFHDQHDDEVFHGFFRKHWTQLLVPFLRFSLTITVIILVILLLRYFLKIELLSITVFRILVLVLFIHLTFEVHRFFLKVLSWYLSIVILTDFRILEIYKTPFLHDEKEGVDLKKVQDIQMRKIGFWRNLLNFGRIYITLASILDAKVITQVPKVSHWLKKCNSVRKEAITKKKSFDLSQGSSKINEIINGA